MKSLLSLVFTSFLLAGTLQAQVLKKLSIGVLGGLNTPMSVRVQGTQPEGFKPERTADFSKGVFMQYDLSDNFYMRGSFKKASINLENRYLQSQNYQASFSNKQLELSLGYRKHIKGGISFTGSLGATYLDFKNLGHPDLLASMTRDPETPYWVNNAPNMVKEKSVLLNAAVGLEYKTRRENVFMLELAFYKGFSTTGAYNFTMDDYLSQTPKVMHYEASLRTKGDYAELRFGYRMPLQKFVNLYTAIKNPKPKPAPEPDTTRQKRYTGKYWGLETGKHTFYANQVQELPGYTDKMQTSSWTSYLTFYKGYQYKSGLSLEGGLRFGAGSILASGEGIIGLDYRWSFLMLTTPISIKYTLPLLRNKIYLSPEAGLWQSYSYGIGGTDYYWPWPRSGEFHNIVGHIKGYGHDYFVGYHVGLSLNGRVGKSCEIGIGYRFADRFSNKPLVLDEITYDSNSGPQPAIVAKSRLQNDAITISFRKFLRKKLKKI